MDDINKVNKEDDSVPKNGNSAIRDSLVNTAVQFLQNPNTRSSPLNMKKEFLKKKGLTDDEIEIAIQKSGLMNNSQFNDLNHQNQMNINSAPPMVPPIYYPQHVPVQPPPSKLIFLRDLANTVVVLSGATYLIYWFYKKYIEPFLFGRKKKEIKRDPVEIEIIRLKETVERINSNVERLDVKLDLSHKNLTEQQELITEISSLKGLLLNRKQFPPIPQTSSNVIPASIPTWQLSENPNINSADDTKKLESSPSNSSNNSSNNDGGSDSSLEMIKEQEIVNNK